MEKQLLARMFFVDGRTETRPLKRVRFCDEDSFLLGGPENLDKIAKEVVGDDDMYIAFVNKIKGIQILRGTFTNVPSHRRDDHPSR